MNWSLSPEAEEELVQVAAYYKDQASVAVACAFLDGFERAASLIAMYPEIGTPASQGRRLLPLRRFAYSLLYRIEGTEGRRYRDRRCNLSRLRTCCHSGRIGRIIGARSSVDPDCAVGTRVLSRVARRGRSKCISLRERVARTV